jgi:hypothetical protein
MTLINSEVIKDTTDVRINSGKSRFLTQGLGLKVDWENTIKEVVVLTSDRDIDLEITIASLANKPYGIRLLPAFTGTWNLSTQTYVINDYSDKKINTEFIHRIKNMRHDMDYKKLCRILSHAVAWNYCAQKEHPIIIIESGNVLTTSEQVHLPRNSILNLTKKPLNAINNNWHSFQGFECYGIDQFVSRQLLQYLYSQGIRDELTVMIRDDLFCIA